MFEAGAEGSARAEAVARLRPLVGVAVQAYFAQAMEHAVYDILGARFASAVQSAPRESGDVNGS